jgi:peptidoglycan/LPS O-acetylase OafA/YrhL
MDYRREIDGLRAVAVLPVLLFHAGFRQFSGGFVGVDIFFVLSGYLITSIILAEKQEGVFTIIGFYERRARRILPALFFVMLMCLPFAWLWMLPGDLKAFSKSLISVSMFASNILFWSESGYFDMAAELKPLLHTWSLAVEEQYYLLFPIFVSACWKLGKRWIVGILVVVASVSLALAQWGAFHDPSATFYLLPTRCWELLIGALAAFHLNGAGKTSVVTERYGRLPSQIISAIGLLLIAYSIFWFDKTTPFPSLYALIPTIGTALLILCATPQTLVGKLLSTGPLVGIGLISYSTYLIHQPLLVFARLHNTNSLSTNLLSGLLLGSLALGYLSWRYIERPFRSRRQTNRNTIFAFSLTGTAAFLLLGLAGYFNNGFESRVSQEIRTLLNAKDGKNPQQTSCLSSEKRFIKPEASCTFGDNRNVIGAVIGDSTGHALIDQLGEKLKAKNSGVSEMTYSGCPSTLGVYRFDLKDDHRCAEYNANVFHYLRDSSTHQYVILASRWTLYLEQDRYDNTEGGAEEGGPVFLDVVDRDIKIENPNPIRRKRVQEQYIKTVKEYVNANKKVILLYPIPEAGWDVPRYLARLRMGNPGNTKDLTTSHQAFIARNKATYDVLDSIGEHANLVRIKPETILCNSFVKDRCVAQLNGVPLYSDDNHLSSAGARLIVEEIIRHVDNN